MTCLQAKGYLLPKDHSGRSCFVFTFCCVLLPRSAHERERERERVCVCVCVCECWNLMLCSAEVRMPCSATRCEVYSATQKSTMLRHAEVHARNAEVLQRGGMVAQNPQRGDPCSASDFFIWRTLFELSLCTTSILWAFPTFDPDVSNPRDSVYSTYTFLQVLIERLEPLQDGEWMLFFVKRSVSLQSD